MIVIEYAEDRLSQISIPCGIPEFRGVKQWYIPSELSVAFFFVVPLHCVTWFLSINVLK